MRVPQAPNALLLGRPKNRRRVFKGDRRSILDENVLWGPDAHGVYWRPVRAYFDDGETLVIASPVHPDEVPAALGGNAT